MSASFSFFYSCVCNPHKTYTPWNWTRHTTGCTAYKAHLEAEKAKILQRAAEQAEMASLVAQEEARIAEQAREEQRKAERLIREREERAQDDLHEELVGPYRLRPARLRKPPRLFPGMIPSQKPRRLFLPPDVQPEGPGEIDGATIPQAAPEDTAGPPGLNPTNSPLPPPLVPHRTVRNAFGLIREYLVDSSPPLMLVPEQSKEMGANTLYTVLPELADVAEQSYSERVRQIIAPLANISIFRLAHWFYTRDNVDSQASSDALISSVICGEDFNPAELKGVTMRMINQDLDSIDVEPSSSDSASSDRRKSDAWRSANLTIYLPTGNSAPPRPQRTPVHAPGSAELFGEPFVVSGFRYRSLLGVLKARFSDPARSQYFQYRPYKQFIQKADGTEERVVDDLYTTDEWLEEHERIQKIEVLDDNSEPCKLERAIAAYMFGSDATIVTDHTERSVWPVYGYFGNEPKWFRRKPGTRASEHLAYIPKVPPDIKDRVAQLHGKAARAPLLAHCKRELFHECWNTMLDPEFIHAYHNGVVLKCGDGITRRLFPRIFTYSADYPEKALIATIRVMGSRPCPRCLVSLQDVSLLGMERDFRMRKTLIRNDNQINVHIARKVIYQDGYTVNSKAVENLLFSKSLVPTLNAFSCRLESDPNFSVHRLLVPDLMHEFELGVWKSLFTHLIRMLDSLGPDTKADFNARFRALGTFGIDTIRRFYDDVTEMKKLAARDYEDILQCSIPCFAGLFPYHDKDIQVLLFVLAEWHFLAKLRMHTDTTISALRAITKVLGTQLRHFQSDITRSYDTYETSKEYRARIRRKVAGKALKSSTESEHINGAGSAATIDAEPIAKVPKQRKEFNLQTYKIHALGDVPGALMRFGTTDSYSTQIIELEHRRVKRQYKRTNHVNAIPQMTLLERREAHLRSRANLLSSLEINPKTEKRRRKLRVTDAYELEIGAQGQWGSPNDKYHIAVRGEPHQLGAFLEKHKGDPAAKDFYLKLERHIASRLGITLSRTRSDLEDSDSISPSHIPQVTFPTLKLHEHPVLRVNFTTYDIHRAHDTISPKTSHRFLMVRNTDTDVRHPFWYAKVLGIYHIDAREAGAGLRHPTQRFDFLWVRWLGGLKWGSRSQRRLDMISYLDSGDHEGSFDFVDPALIIRGAYLAPVFNLGRTKDLIRQSLAWDCLEEGDWAAYYVIRFVDRDMGMRYFGGGIGHCDPIPPSDADAADEECNEDEEVAPIGLVQDTEPAVASESSEESEGDDDSADSDSDDSDVLDEEGAFDI